MKLTSLLSLFILKKIKLSEGISFGISVFDSPEQYNLWSNTPSLALNNMKHLELLMNSYDKEMVMSEINRIEYGIFA